MPTIYDIYYHDHSGSRVNLRPPVILLHGAGGNHLYWPAEMRRLPAYRVLAPDLPGHGKSGGRGYQSIQAYGQAITNWMVALEVFSAVFVGHSMGSAIALNMALEHSEHVSGLVLVGAGARLRVSLDLIENTASAATFQNAVDIITQRAFGPQTPGRLVALAAKRMAETRPSVLHSDFLACNGFDVINRINKVIQPTLVIHGSEDCMTPPRYGQFLVDQIALAQFQIIPGAGHMVMLEQPQMVTRLVLDFLDHLPA